MDNIIQPIIDFTQRRTFHKTLVLCVTFIAYSCYHMGRRPLSIVKNVLNRNCSEVHHISMFEGIEMFSYVEYESPGSHQSKNSSWCDWAPFDNDATANQLLALLDSAFLFSYAIFMFFSGYLADRCDLVYFLTAGMMMSGILLYAFGFAFYLNIHSMTYFIIVQILSGAVQTTGWPTVVTCIGNWFEPHSRGAIFGLWNANTNLGNILGTAIAGFFVERSWGLSFVAPGFLMMCCGMFVFMCLFPKPEDVGLLSIKDLKNQSALRADYEGSITQEIPTREVEESTPYHQPSNRRKQLRKVIEDDSAVSETDDSQTSNSEHRPLINQDSDNSSAHEIHASHDRAVSFWTCLKIPGVIEYSMCLGFAKLVSYTFLYWLPRYITQSTSNNSEQSAYLSVPFDIGGIVGAVVAGIISDRYKKSASTCTVMLILAIPSMFIYQKFASISNLYNIIIQLLVGALVTGPYALITTAVSTDLGSRIKDGKSMATVAAIIDGTGSIGAAIGPLFAGYVSDSGWESVFVMLMLSDLIASMCLTRITLKELGFR